MKFVELGTKALRTIGAVGQGVGVSANDLQVAFEAQADLFDSWAAQRLTIYQTLRRVFPIVANQGGPDNPYTIGTGGDLDVPRPTWLPNANVIMDTSTPPIEYPLTIFKPQEYARTAIKDLASALCTAIYFDGQWDNDGAAQGLGNIFLYPVPNGQMPLRLALYLPFPMQGFADMAETDYTFPPGYAEALRYQLAHRLASEFQKSLSAETQALVVSTFAVIQRDNVPIPNISSDYGLPGTGPGQGLYNWRTGENTTLGGR